MVSCFFPQRFMPSRPRTRVRLFHSWSLYALFIPVLWFCREQSRVQALDRTPRFVILWFCDFNSLFKLSFAVLLHRVFGLVGLGLGGRCSSKTSMCCKAQISTWLYVAVWTSSSSSSSCLALVGSFRAVPPRWLTTFFLEGRGHCLYLLYFVLCDLVVLARDLCKRTYLKWLIAPDTAEYMEGTGRR